MISKVIIEDKKTLDIVERIKILRSQFLDRIEKQICKGYKVIVTVKGRTKSIRTVHIQYTEHFVDEDSGEVVDVTQTSLIRKGDTFYLNGKRLNVNKFLLN